MKILLKSAFVFLVTVGLFTSCKKDKEISRTALISQQPWILKAYTATTLSDGTVNDGFAPMSICYKDDQYVYKANMTYEGNAGTTKCSAADPQVFSTGTWKFTNNETVLERIITTGVSVGMVDFKIISLTGNELIISLDESGYHHELKFSH